jgi:GTP-binding protein EngB required for normal cell division
MATFLALGLTRSPSLTKPSVICFRADLARAAARTKSIEFFHIEDGLKFRVVATKLDKVKERA